MGERLLTLVRHGRTTANASNLLQGHIDNPLDEVGQAQAALLADALQRVGPITRLISSPLMRARQTAEAIHLGGPLQCGVEIDVRWIELNYGDYDAQPASSIPPEVWAQWRVNEHFRPPNGETLGELNVRVCEALSDLVAVAQDDLSQKHMDEHIVVVSHVSPIKAAVAWALGVGIETSWRTTLDRASMSTIRLDPHRPSLKTFNVTAHDFD